MCQNAYFPSLQGIRMLRSTKEEQKTDVWSAKKKIQQPENKLTALLKELCYNPNSKINVKKFLGNFTPSTANQNVQAQTQKGILSITPFK